MIPKSELKKIRARREERGGYHPHPLHLGGPPGQTLTQTGETRWVVNPQHRNATILHMKMLNAIRKEMAKQSRG